MKNQKFMVRFLCVFLAVLMILSVIMMVIPVRAVSEHDIALLKARRVDLEKQLAEQDELIRTLTENKALIIDRGYDPLYGARPLRRYLQSSVETLLARAILSGDLAAGATLTVDTENGELVCR